MAEQGQIDNRGAAGAFRRLADLLEIRGESLYRVAAYRRAAESFDRLAEPITAVRARGELEDIPGVGTAIARKVEDLLDSGSFDLLREVEAEIPPGVAALLSVPDIGPKRARLLYRELGVESLEDLREALDQGRLDPIPGLGAGAARRIAEGLNSLQATDERLPLGVAHARGLALIARLRERAPGIRRIELAGSVRRHRETVGDLDIAAAADDPAAVVEAFATLPEVANIELRGPNRCRLVLVDGFPADLWVLPERHWGSLLFHLTGDKHHDIRVREMAVARGGRLSEYGFSAGGDLTPFAEEEDVYAFFGLQPIPPPMREDPAALDLAGRGALPEVLEVEHLRADLHLHTDWSDGKGTVREMALAARARGYSYIAVTDHSRGLAVANGLGPERLREQRAEIDAVNAELAPFRVLQGIELEVRGDGRLDLDDDTLAALDLVVAAVHSGLRQGRERVTERALAAIRHPLVDVLAHPTGRIVGGRAGGDFDLVALYAEAARTGTALEIDADPARLDLRDVHARAAVAAGCTLTVDSDAHVPGGLANASFGVGVAQRAWVPPDRVLNTLPLDALLGRLKRNRSLPS
ncbi:MAG: DNA polymerase X family [uncultured Thermomicrobiales bacterium]|uniref:DNA polymerase beta n=1 Tax=uncultured Thermomicrobiales bacterium TaxID=1645740 RepID=A0A6J4VIG6_9BACT|nr:MAG: DNA polymerase X family [uncultured Thermomicrobiales bacterium]